VFFEGVGDVFEEDEAEDDVLVFRRVHVVAQLVGGEPERGLEADGGGGLGGGSGRFSAGHEGSQVCWRALTYRPGTNPQRKVPAVMRRIGSSETGENGEAGRRKDPETVRAKPAEQAKQQTVVNSAKWKAPLRNRAQIVGFRACPEQADGHTRPLLSIALKNPILICRVAASASEWTRTTRWRSRLRKTMRGPLAGARGYFTTSSTLPGVSNSGRITGASLPGSQMTLKGTALRL